MLAMGTTCKGYQSQWISLAKDSKGKGYNLGISSRMDAIL